MRTPENTHLLEYLELRNGKRITVNRVIKDEDWFTESDEIVLRYDTEENPVVYVRANHHTKIKDGKALTRSGEWVKIRTKTKTSMKTESLYGEHGVLVGRRLTFGTEELARAMLEEFKKHTTNVSIEGACVTIQYEWGVLPMYEIQWIYSDVRAFM